MSVPARTKEAFYSKKEENTEIFLALLKNINIMKNIKVRIVPIIIDAFFKKFEIQESYETILSIILITISIYNVSTFIHLTLC